MICPKCSSLLSKTIDGKSYKCINNHNYDISKDNYINLLLSKTNSGDNKTLIEGRINFLSKDFYYPLVTKIDELLSMYDIKTICDCGCGVGYYSSKLACKYNVYGIDISKEAIKYAAKHDTKSTYIVASNQSVPFEDNYFDAVLQIFSPVFSDETLRITKDKGLLLLVNPGAHHLFEMKQLLYKDPYLNDEHSLNIPYYKQLENIRLKYNIHINNDDFHNLIKMTPYYYKTDSNIITNIVLTEDICITIDFIISLYSKE